MASGYMTSGCFCGNKMQQDATRLSRKALKDDGALPSEYEKFRCLPAACSLRPKMHLKLHGGGMW